jgi:hypothetical protein
MILRTRKMSGVTSSDGMTAEEYLKSLGLNLAGRNSKHASGGAFRAAHISVSTFLFVIYVIMDGNPFFVVLADSSPIIEHRSSNTTDPSKAALEALLAKRLVRTGTHKPTVIHPVHGLFDKPVIHFVEVDQTALVQPGHSMLGSKVYSLVVPETGKSQGGKDSSFGLANYSKLRAALLPMLSSSTSAPKAAFARGGGGGGAVAFGGGGAAVAASHHHGGKKTYPAPTCGHCLCTDLHDEGAGHGGIVIPYFEYHCKDGSKKTATIMIYEERRSWNFLCERMEDKDNGCWIATIQRALREEGKLFLSRDLEKADIKLGKPIRRTPVFYVELERNMVKHNLSRGVLNSQVAADNSNPSLPPCYKEIQAIGFFERIGGNLVPLPGNPSCYPDIFSDVVKSWLSS